MNENKSHEIMVPVRAVRRVSQTAMPSTVFDRYERVAVMLMLDGAPAPKMISDKAAGCVSILYCSAPVPSAGKTKRSGLFKAHEAAEAHEAAAPTSVPFEHLSPRLQSYAAALALGRALRKVAS